MRISYFVHDLSDAAVAKRIRMLKAAGAEIVLFGFRRSQAPIDQVDGVPAFDLGRTHDARLIGRALMVARNLLLAPSWRRRIAGADVIMARNLEVLVLAAAARRLHAPRARLAYECLDIHRIMLKPSRPARLLRALEARLLAQSDLLLVSSSAFLREYFEPFQRISALPLDTVVVENKTFAFPAAPDLADKPPPRPPWRIGWFGMIRCRRSLDLLTDLARRRPDLVRIDIAGRPAYTEFDDFDGQVAGLANVAFRGPYRPADLPAIYGRIHFNWAIDYFEDEGNSRWLLPNRLYEGGCFGVPAISRRGCETGRWLESRGLGVLMDDPARELEAFLEGLTAEAYAALQARHAGADLDHFVLGPEDCAGLARRLAGTPSSVPAAPSGVLAPSA